MHTKWAKYNYLGFICDYLFRKAEYLPKNYSANKCLLVAIFMRYAFNLIWMLLLVFNPFLICEFQVPIKKECFLSFYPMQFYQTFRFFLFYFELKNDAGILSRLAAGIDMIIYVQRDSNKTANVRNSIKKNLQTSTLKFRVMGICFLENKYHIFLKSNYKLSIMLYYFNF